MKYLPDVLLFLGIACFFTFAAIFYPFAMLPMAGALLLCFAHVLYAAERKPE